MADICPKCGAAFAIAMESGTKIWRQWMCKSGEWFGRGFQQSDKCLIRQLQAENAALTGFHRIVHYLASEDLADMVFFFERGDDIGVAVNCNDMFWWATADAEDITPANLDVLIQSVNDCKAIDKYEWVHGLDLFACRVRKMRPQDAAYPDCKELWPLFDAAGPEREIDKGAFGNPFPREAYWQKRQERRKTEIETLKAEVAALRKELADETMKALDRGIEIEALRADKEKVCVAAEALIEALKHGRQWGFAMHDLRAAIDAARPSPGNGA